MLRLQQATHENLFLNAIGEEILPRYIMAIWVVAYLLVSPLMVLGGDFDGSKPLVGKTGKIIEINPYKIVTDIDPDTIGLPKKFLIDFKKKTFQPSKESLVRKIVTFKHIEKIENKIIIQGIDTGIDGVDDGLAWSLTISRKDGRSVMAASGDGKAYVVFGTCTPVKDLP